MNFINMINIVILMAIVGGLLVQKHKNISKELFNKAFTKYIESLLDITIDLYNEYKRVGMDPFNMANIKASEEFTITLGNKIKKFMIEVLEIDSKIVNLIPPDLLMEYSDHLIILLRREINTFEKINKDKKIIKTVGDKTNILDAIEKASKED